MSDSKTEPAILFWFYRDPSTVVDRLAFIRRLNPAARIYGLFGGPDAKLRQFADAIKLLDDVWIHPPVGREWAWDNGDRMVARWHIERGLHLPWEQLLVHQWDLLTTRPVADFATSGPQEVLLTGVRPLAEVAMHWVWVQPWSIRYPTWQEFRRHPLVIGRPMLASIFILATLTRRFMDDYSSVAFDVPGFIEYRLPTIAAALGYRFAPTDLNPDWGDQGDPLLNGDGREVQATAIEHRFGRDGRGVKICHPVRIARWTNRAAPIKDGDTVTPQLRNQIAVLQTTSARPGTATDRLQLVASVLANALAASGDEVHLLSGTNDREREVASAVVAGVHYLPAFASGEISPERQVQTITFFAAAAATLSRCRYVLMFGRTFPVPAEARRVLVLGTSTSESTRLAILNEGWDDLIVPSDSMRDEAVTLLRDPRSARLERIHVVASPVDLVSLGLSGCRPFARQKRGRIRLLCPPRDEGHGIASCLRLLARLATRRDVELVVVINTTPTNPPGFYMWLAAEASRLGVFERLVIEPLAPINRTAALYQSADLTLCMSDGLGRVSPAIAESILCCTPVLALADAGAVPLPPGMGCVTVPYDDAAIQIAAERILDDMTVTNAAFRGSDFVRSEFSLAKFVSAIRGICEANRSGAVR